MSSALAVHPRERGEHARQPAVKQHVAGSSPRARGTRLSQRAMGYTYRFIPASAGNTNFTQAAKFWYTVHPRERGEHESGVAGGALHAGSSPRARGTLLNHPGAGLRDRFIPASAGNTVAPRPARSATAVHPRERGEHGGEGNAPVIPSGSSPRARGTREQILPELRPYRFIPASAGNTHGCGRARGPRPVHPRERGEHLADAEAGHLQAGSSPRARGTRLTSVRRPPSRRFIPASAGNTRLRRAG